MIRPIQQKDNAAIANTIRSAFEEFGAPKQHTVYSDPETDHLFEYFSSTPRSGYFVAEVDGVTVGGCGYFPTPGLPEGCAELVKFYLNRDARGKGIGTKLFVAVEEAAKQAGYSKIYIESFPEFQTAVSLYARHGYKTLPHRLGNSGHTATSIHVIKNL